MAYGQPHGFIVAHLDSQSVPLVRESAVGEDETFYAGALLVLNSSGAVEECGSDPDVVDGVSLARYGVPDDPSFDILGTKGVPPGKMQWIVVRRGDRSQLWSALYQGDMGTVGGVYGVTRGTDGVWRVDFTKNTEEVVRLESTEWTNDPIGKNRVLVSFVLPAS